MVECFFREPCGASGFLGQGFLFLDRGESVSFGDWVLACLHCSTRVRFRVFEGAFGFSAGCQVIFLH